MGFLGVSEGGLEHAFEGNLPGLGKSHQLTYTGQARSARIHEKRPGVLRAGPGNSLAGVTFGDSGQGGTRARSAAMGGSRCMTDTLVACTESVDLGVYLDACERLLIPMSTRRTEFSLGGSCPSLRLCRG